MDVKSRLQKIQTPKFTRPQMIGIVVILIIIVLIILKPASRTANAHNEQRTKDITAILDAVHKYVNDDANSNNFPPGIPSVAKCATATSAGEPPAGALDVGTRGAKLTNLLVKTYIDAIPQDPTNGTPETTGYVICSDSATNAITVWATHTESKKSDTNPDLSVTR